MKSKTIIATKHSSQSKGVVERNIILNKTLFTEGYIQNQHQAKTTNAVLVEKHYLHHESGSAHSTSMIPGPKMVAFATASASANESAAVVTAAIVSPFIKN